MTNAGAGSGEQPRLSTLAAVSAALAVASLAACAVVGVLSTMVSPVYFAAMVVLPALGASAVISGALGFAAIRRSGGGLVGRPLAAAGVLLGLLSAVVQGSMGGSALATYTSMRTTLAPAAERALVALGADDLGAAREMLAPATAGAVSDERARAFIGAVEGACGRVQRVEFDHRVVTEVHARMRSARGAAGAPAPGGQPMKPVRVVGATGEALAWVSLDEDALSAGKVRLLDAVVLLPGDEAATLLPDGPGAVLARFLGLKTVP